MFNQSVYSLVINRITEREIQFSEYYKTRLLGEQKELMVKRHSSITETDVLFKGRKREMC
jgi:hypothetical protein